ncbi:MAG: hypothetical protein JXA13_15240 [Anaerolineales bacterium]|nr:hypothetical protein [Anaerolineales bacterium]
MRLFYKIASYLLLIGVIHTALTPVFYPGFTLEALWFAGTGLALVFLALLNITAERLMASWVLDLCLVANLAGTIFGILIVMLLPEIQAYLSLGIFLAVTAGAFGVRRLASTGNDQTTSQESEE